MNILNEIVEHKTWGEGKILRFEGSGVVVEFDMGEKKIQFPETFEKFISFKNAKLQTYVLELLKEKRSNAARAMQERQDEQKFLKEAKMREMKPVYGVKKKEIEKANVAFKCNFCDGGCSVNCIGYKGVCSDEIIRYNIEVARRTWCCNEESPCFQYYNGDITRGELEDYMAGGVVDAGYVCYESQMLINWRAFAGYALTKENYQKPMTLPQVKPRSLCVLTTREPDSNEEERIIFAVFLVDETFEGDNRSEGYVTTSSKFRLSFSMKEARKLKYWNYYANRKNPEKVAWAQGLHRYIDDIQAAQMLRDIVKLKKGTKDEELAEEFYNYFLQINGFEADDIPKNRGALLR